MQKSYNQKYKESGTTLTYKEWRRREDEKMASFDGIPAPKIDTKEAFKKAEDEISRISNYQTKTTGKTFLGIQNTYIWIGALILVSAVGYKIYKNYNK